MHFGMVDHVKSRTVLEWTSLWSKLPVFFKCFANENISNFTTVCSLRENISSKVFILQIAFDNRLIIKFGQLAQVIFMMFHLKRNAMVEKKFNVCLFLKKEPNETNQTFVIDSSVLTDNLFSENAYVLGTEGVDTYICLSVSIAVKEIIIEWNDLNHLTEISGVISCEDSLKYIKSKKSFDSNLIRFLKPPGRKTCLIKVPKEEMVFIELDQEKFYVKKAEETKYKSLGHCLFHIDLNQSIELKIKPLFNDKNSLPIDNAHISVEISVKYCSWD